MSRKSGLFLLVLAALTLAPTLAFALPHATARLTGAQEVPAVVTGATGTASLRLNETRTELAFDITVQGLSGPMTGAHFHNAPAGVNGGVVRTITEFAGNTASGVWTSTDGEPLTAALVNELFSGNIYVNIHTAINGGGEIRGQVDVIAGIHARASLTGNQEVPAVATAATGTGVFTLTDAGLAFDITVEGLSGAITGAHFHNAIPGVNGGVVRGLVGGELVGNTASGIWTKTDGQPLTAALVGQLLAGRIYFNFHTGANPGGEIRGQVLPASREGLTARLDESQEVGPTGEPGKGTGSFFLNSLQTELTFNITVEGLTGGITGSHFHNAPAGVNGGVVRGLVAGELVGNTASGVWKSTDAQPLTPTLVNELLAGRIYFNIHTAAHSGGEIRGQLRLTTGMGRTATLDGGEEVPPVATLATGTGSLVLTESGVVFDATVEGLTMTMAHFHNAPAGVNGGVVRTLTGDFTGSTATGTWTPADGEPLTAALIGEYVAGNLYMNVHTLANGGGEIRGQLDRTSLVGIAPEGAPQRLLLTQNYPNPFTPTTTIRYELATREHVTLTLHDVLGRQVAVLVDEVQAGPQSITVDSRGLASGVYFYRIATPSFSNTRKLVLTK